MKCEACGKTPMFGHNVSHSKRRTNTKFMPNIHVTTMLVDGRKKRFHLCTRCQRTQVKVA